MALNLAEREYRKRMLLGGSATELRGSAVAARREEAAPQIPGRWAPLYLATVGAVAGFLGSVSSLFFNVLGAWASGIDKLMLLRVYATIIEGPSALDPRNSSFFLSVLLTHLAVGSFFGALFVLAVRRIAAGAALMRTLSYGLLFGLAIWVVNFYLLLSWLQPLMSGEAYIVNGIPWWVAGLTHSCYGLTLALVSFPFQSDVESGYEEEGRATIDKAI